MLTDDWLRTSGIVWSWWPWDVEAALLFVPRPRRFSSILFQLR